MDSAAAPPARVPAAEFAGKVVGPEMVKELETYYEQKRRRDLDRRGKVEAGPGPGEDRRPAIPPVSEVKESGKR